MLLHGISRLLLGIVDLIEILLGFRFLFTLLGIAEDRSFAKPVYVLSRYLLFFIPREIPYHAFYSLMIDTHAVLGMIVYLLLGYMIMKVFSFAPSKKT